MLKRFLFISLLLTNISTCVKRVTLDISNPDGENFVTEVTTWDGRPSKYIVPKPGVITTAIYDNDSLVWERTYGNQLLNHVRVTIGLNGLMAVNSSVPGTTKILQHYSCYQNKWLNFKTYDSNEARKARLKESLEKKKSGQKQEFYEESFASSDYQELEENDVCNIEENPSSQDAGKQHEKDSDNRLDNLKLLKEEENLDIEPEEHPEKDIEGDEKRDNDRQRPGCKDQSEKGVQRTEKSTDSSLTQKVLRDIDVLTKFQELVSEGDDGSEHQTTQAKIDEKDKDNDDDSFKTCIEFMMDSSLCDECELKEQGQVCLVKSKSRCPSPERSQDVDSSDKDKKSKKGLNCLESEISIYLGIKSGSDGPKILDTGDSLSQILAGMTDDEDDKELSSLLIGGPESDETRRLSTFEPPKKEGGYIGFSTFDDDDLVLEPVPEDQYGFLVLTESEDSDSDDKKLLSAMHNYKPVEFIDGELPQKPKKTFSMRFTKKEKKLKKTTKRTAGELKTGFISSSRKKSEQKSRTNSRASSQHSIVESIDPSSDDGLLGQSLKAPTKDASKSGLRGHSESDLIKLLKENKPLDEFRLKSDSDLTRDDSLAPGTKSAPSTLQRPKKKFHEKINLLTRSSSELTRGNLKKSKAKSLSKHLLSFLVKEGIKRGIDEVQKRKAKKESLKEQSKDLESRADYQPDDSQTFQTEQSDVEGQYKTSGKLEKEQDTDTSKTKEGKDQESDPTEPKDQPVESEPIQTDKFKPTDHVDPNISCQTEGAEQHPDQPKKDVDKIIQKLETDDDKPNPYDSALYNLLGARPKTKSSHKYTIKKESLKEKMKIPRIIVQNPECEIIEAKIDIPEKKQRRIKLKREKSKTKSKDKDKKTKRDEVEQLANDEFIIQQRPKEGEKEETEEKEENEEDDDGEKSDEKCKLLKTRVKWDDEDDDQHEKRRKEISRAYLRQPRSSCCSVS